MKQLASLLLLTAACSASDNLGDTPVLGQQHWTLTLGAAHADSATKNGIAFLPDGNLVVAGRFHDTVDFGTSTIASSGNAGGDIFLTKRSVADGGELWTKSFGRVNDDWLTLSTLAVDSAGNLVIAGTYGVSEDFGGTKLAPSDGYAFVAKYDGTGQLVWVRGFGRGTMITPRSLSIGPDDSVTVLGGVNTAPTTIQLPDHSVHCEINACPDWIVHFAADGTPQWDEFMPVGLGIGNIVALDDGSFEVAGSVAQATTLGDSQIVAVSAITPVIVHLGNDGGIEHAATYGVAQQYYDDIALAKHDDGVVALSNTWMNDGTNNSTVPHLAGVDASGDIAWNAEGSMGPASGFSLAQAPNGALLVAGIISNYVADFGKGPINGATFIASYAPNGDFLDARSYGASGSATGDGITSLAVSPSGAVAFIGSISDTLDFGTGPQTSHGQTDVVIGLIDPPAP